MYRFLIFALHFPPILGAHLQGPKIIIIWGFSFLFIAELGPICNSMAAPFGYKSCEDHSLLKSYIGGIWALKKNFRHVLLDTLAAIYVAFHVFFLYSVLISISPIMVSAFKSPPFDQLKGGLTSGEQVMVVQFCKTYWAVKLVSCISAP